MSSRPRSASRSLPTTARSPASSRASAARPALRRRGTLDAARLDDLHGRYVAYYERFRGPDGVSVPKPFLIVLGTRRSA